jgi:ribosomal protein S18 acetylase RimI-like enzyme
MPQNTWPWNRAQLVVTQAELESYAASVFVNFFYAREGGHGVPVPYMLVPLTNANIQEAEGRLPALRTYRWWQRLKNAVRSRQGQALVSLQVGEFYKHGKWWRSNTVRENVGKHRHVPTTNYDRLQLEAGMKVEMEHTDDAAEALEIAKDHLDEIPDYYTRLFKMEKKALRKQEKKALKAFRHERHKMLGPVAFDFKMDENPAPASFHMAQFRSDVYPIKVIDEFLQRHAEGWVTSFQRHYNLDRLPVTKRVYIAVSIDPADKNKPLVDKIIGVMGITQNRWDNIDDVFVAVHTAYRRMGVGKQMNILLFDLARKWINPETGRGARRIYLLVKDANEGSKTMVTSVGFAQIEQFLNTAGELVNRYVKDLYEPPRENP